MIALCLGLVAVALGADELRVGLFVGNNHGNTTDQPLVFAVSDARKMRDLFVEFGRITPQDAILVENGTRRNVERALDQLRFRLALGRAHGLQTTLIFYYSGHGDERALHLGTTELTHADLRAWLEASGADVRLAMLDACQSGSAVRAKGARRGPNVAFAVDVEQIKGTAILTSSAASEVSQESAEVGGGFFTHYLHTALLGAADLDRNGEVGLNEAWTYVRGETAFATRDAPNSQTPRFDWDLVGSADLVLTTLERATSHLSFHGDLDGALAIWDASRKRYVAEIAGDRPVQLAVRPGTYFVHRRMPGWVDEARYNVRRGETLSVFQEDFVSVSYNDVASRGDLARQVRRARMPMLSLRALAGVRGFGNTVYGQQYVPTHAVGGVEARFLRPGGGWFGFDLLSGGGAGTLLLDEIGDKPVHVTSTSFGGALGVATKPRLLRAGVGANAEIIGFSRTFPDGDDQRQGTLTVAFGPTGWVGVHHGRFSYELQVDLLMMAATWDQHEGWPVYAEVIPLSLGIRF